MRKNKFGKGVKEIFFGHLCLFLCIFITKTGQFPENKGELQ